MTSPTLTRQPIEEASLSTCHTQKDKGVQYLRETIEMSRHQMWDFIYERK